MMHKGFSPQTLDLFEVTLTIPTPPDTASAPATPPGLAALSDAELACRLGEIVEEVQRRLAKGRGGRPDLTAAAQQAGRSLQTLGPGPAKPARSSWRAKAPTVLQ